MISVCIANRGNSLGLWATICAAEAQLDGMTHEYCIFTNGRELDEPLQLIREHLSNSVSFGHSAVSLPPPQARTRAAELARGKLLIFLDDHVILGRNWLARIWELAAEKSRVVHSSYTTHVGGPRYFGYGPLDWDTLRGDYRTEPATWSPHCIAAGSHGAFAVHRDTFFEIGYGDFWEGFAGEETYFSVKAWMAGFEVWMVPEACFYHYSVRDETRGYERQINPENFARGQGELAGATLKHSFEDIRRRFEAQ